MIKNYASYGRVSSQEQKKNTSVGTQLESVTRTALEMSPDAVCVKQFTDVASARSFERPGLKEAYSYIKWYNQVANTPIGHFLVHAWDRFGRNRDKSAEMRNKFKDIGTEVNAVTEWVNYNDSGEIIVHSVREAIAEAESMKNSERTKRGQLQRMRDGFWIFDVHKGYRKSDVLNSNGTRSIVIDELPARAKAKALEMIASGVGKKSAWRQCGEREMLGSYNAFIESLLSPFDLGMIDYTFPNGQRVHTEGRHPAIVTKELQGKARAAMKTREVAPTRQTERLIRNPARQVICCPKCGKPMPSSTPKGRNVRHEYYSCYRSVKRGACGKFNIRRSIAHSYIFDLLSTVSLGEEALKRMERKANQAIGKTALLADLRKAIEKNDVAQRRKQSAFDMRLDKEISQKDYDRANKIADNAEEAVNEARLSVQGYEVMRTKLSTVFENIGPAIAKGFTDDATPRQAMKAHHFLNMLFPSGLCLDPETGTFGTEEMNRILCGTGLLSVSYAGLNNEAPTLTAGAYGQNPEKGGRPVVIRTLGDDKRLVDSYLAKYA